MIFRDYLGGFGFISPTFSHQIDGGQTGGTHRMHLGVQELGTPGTVHWFNIPEKGGQHHAFSPLFRTFPQLPGDDQPKFEKLRKLCRAAATGRLGGDPCSDFCWVSIP